MSPLNSETRAFSGGAMTTVERAERSGVSASHSGYHAISGACEVG